VSCILYNKTVHLSIHDKMWNNINNTPPWREDDVLLGSDDDYHLQNATEESATMHLQVVLTTLLQEIWAATRYYLRNIVVYISAFLPEIWAATRYYTRSSVVYRSAFLPEIWAATRYYTRSIVVYISAFLPEIWAATIYNTRSSVVYVSAFLQDLKSTIQENVVVEVIREHGTIQKYRSSLWISLLVLSLVSVTLFFWRRRRRINSQFIPNSSNGHNKHPKKKAKSILKKQQMKEQLTATSTTTGNSNNDNTTPTDSLVLVPSARRDQEEDPNMQFFPLSPKLCQTCRIQNRKGNTMRMIQSSRVWDITLGPSKGKGLAALLVAKQTSPWAKHTHKKARIALEVIGSAKQKTVDLSSCKKKRFVVSLRDIQKKHSSRMAAKQRNNNNDDAEDIMGDPRLEGDYLGT
jgi:hypothetical protein